MKETMTPRMKDAYELLEKHGKLYKLNDYCQPAEFVRFEHKEKSLQDMGKLGWKKRANRQSLNKLVMLGLARYTDKEKTIIETVENDSCGWCANDLIYHYGEMRTIADDENGNDSALSLREWKFCPNCGRKLEEKR